MTESTPPSKRWPLTGTVSIEWVDAADPSDPEAEPYFGSFGITTDRPLDLRRLVALLHFVAETQQKFLDDEESQNGSPDR